MLAVLLSLTVAVLPLEADATAAIEAHRQSNDFPAVSTAIVIEGRIAFAGIADLASNDAMTPDRPLDAGSASKVFTAALVLNLVQSGELSLDDYPTIGGPVDAVTVMDLLTHSSGLPREGDFNYWFTGVFPDRKDPETYLDRTELVSRPDSRLTYSNIGYAALGRAMGQRTGERYEDLLSRRLLASIPLSVIAFSVNTIRPGR